MTKTAAEKAVMLGIWTIELMLVWLIAHMQFPKQCICDRSQVDYILARFVTMPGSGLSGGHVCKVYSCDAGERIGKLIRNAEKAKTPVMCVVGEKEASSNQLSVRTYGEEGDRGVMAVSEVITRIQDAGRTRMPF